MLPSLFLSHGAPTLPLTDAPATHFLRALPALLEAPPDSILVVSAHWETETPRVTAVAVNQTIHDFFGFPTALSEIRYPAPGSPVIAARVEACLRAAGFACDLDRERGLDHGAWVPLMLMYPEADVPVLQLSLQRGQGPDYHLALGRALAPLREAGVLVIGSGSFTHDLAGFRRQRAGGGETEPESVRAFADWFDEALRAGNRSALLDYRRQAPFAAENHPTEEHLLPLFVALGAGGGAVERWHSSVTHGVLRMDAYAFCSFSKRKLPRI